VKKKVIIFPIRIHEPLEIYQVKKSALDC